MTWLAPEIVPADEPFHGGEREMLQGFLQHAVSKREASNSQFVTPALKLRGNDCDSVASLGECQQGVWVPALEEECRFQSRHSAC